ncbi:MAG: sensor histidine kinase [Clostridiales bacterium]|nr:sensor histidine kinase [Clostridiales bacterium]
MSKKQKQRVILVFLPPVCYWLISIFVPRLFDIFYPFDLESNIFELWQANIIITLIGIFIFIVVAFKDGFMGLKLVSQRYNWDSNMGLINMSAEYTSHMFKQQASIMELCINQLKEHYISADSDEEVHERLDILSRSVSTLTGFVDRIKRHSQIIQLTEGSYRITDLLSYSTSLAKDSGISIRIMIPENLFLICDKIHMTEVFANITKNAIEAIHENGIIEISGLSERSKYRLMFKDNGAGIDDDKLQNVFMPHFSTKKNTEKNFGLGLYYCKNVIIKHGGSISAESIKGKETTIIISFSAKRVVMSGEPEFSAVSKALTSISLEMRGNDG